MYANRPLRRGSAGFDLLFSVLSIVSGRCVLVYVHSSFAIILKKKRKLVARLLLSYRYLYTVDVL